MIKDNWVKLKEKKTINEKYETTYAFEKGVDGTNGMIIQTMHNLHMQ